MGIKIIKDNGVARSTWYARFKRNGKQMDVNLEVPVRGTIPLDAKGDICLKQLGDAAFERSRKAAQRAFEQVRKRAGREIANNRERKAEAEAGILKAAHKVLTGEGQMSIPLSDLPAKWRAIARTYTPTEDRMKVYDATFRRFATFARRYGEEHGFACVTLDDVTADLAHAYFEELRTTYAWETVKSQSHLLSSAFTRWCTNGLPNPFKSIIKRNRELASAKVSRKPLTETEVARLFEISSCDAFYHNLIITAACTGMRIGDVCHLHWSDVDLRNGLIDVLTSKAGIRVTIPIFTPLRKVLEARLAECDETTPFVFPKAAAIYDSKNRTSIVRSVKPFFARAVFPEEAPEQAVLLHKGKKPKSLNLNAILDLIQKAPYIPAKKERLLEVIIRFKGGERSDRIATALRIARGQVSNYLRDLEALTGETYRPGLGKHHQQDPNAARTLADKTRERRKVGKHAASLYGWHSLRATFVVLAVQAGVALPDIQKIVGHSEVEMTMQYYNPTHRHAAARLAQKMQKSVLNQTEKPALPSSHSLCVPDNIPANVWAILTDEQKKQLLGKH